ncbi:PBSX family phage terminase large subunit [Rhizorhabdus wittichii]|uniref:PBSX family phage terminase large subunit n=1 Tax=Rhizorhabdus wittichii TaxID=160791 RepID=A0A975HC94_9SPHN|nr:PBSX family phage terminase large subunit [Rhizorhabdus wittichii]QTH20146.1 PBSX family phage terminase large subunit [Rhizorhabdus wittichii]
MIEVDLPEWAQWLDVPLAPDRSSVRHRVLYGGRAGGKSWTIAYKLLERALRRAERILCTREFQNSIRDSSKKLIEDWIHRLGLGYFFTITEREIRGQNGSVFTFMGLHGKDNAIRSLEGYTLVWVEEAASISQASIEALVPTIRRDKSEIWWSYNPRYRSDPVDQRFRGEGGPPPGTVILNVGWRDNPNFPEVLRRDMEYDRERDPEKYAHIWNGDYLDRSATRVFDRWRVSPFEAPSDAVLRFGADWGHAADPTVLVRCFIGRWAGEPFASEIIADQDGKYLFVDWEAYMIGCPIDELPSLFAGFDNRDPERWENPRRHPGIPGAIRHLITADSARSDTIEYMAQRGFRIRPAIKGPGSVEDGIDFLRSYEIVVHPRCRYLADELLMYSWKTDRLTGDILPKLADSHNHVIDSLRYALEGARKAIQSNYDFASAGPRVSTNLPGFQFGGRNWSAGPPLPGRRRF